MTLLKVQFIGAVVAVVLLTGGGILVVTRAQNAASPSSAPAAVVVDQAAPVRTDDLLSISIADFMAGQAETTVTPRVDAQGQIVLLMVGSIRVAGMTTDQVTTAVQNAYINRGLLRQPRVKVERLEDAAHASVRSGPIAEGDALRIRIFDLEPGKPETMLETNVVGKTVIVPRFGEVEVAGKTEAQATRAIAAAYKDKQMLMQPIIEVLRIKATGK